ALVFPANIATDHGINIAGGPYIGLGTALFRANQNGAITPLVSPGDPAPGGGRFDSVSFGPWSNDKGDVAFAGHVAGDEAHVPGYPTQDRKSTRLNSSH